MVWKSKNFYEILHKISFILAIELILLENQTHQLCKVVNNITWVHNRNQTWNWKHWFEHRCNVYIKLTNKSELPLQMEEGFLLGWKVTSCFVFVNTVITYGEGNGTSLQYSCLENPMDGGAWKAVVHGVARVRHDWATSHSLFTFMHWRRKWQPPSVLAWRIPGTAEHGGLPSMGSQRVRHDWSDLAAAAAAAVLALWRRQWHPTLVLLSGKSHGWRSLEGCSPWGCWGSDMTEQLHFHSSLSCIGEGNGNPLQCSCLENPRERGAW